ncbi:MAG TPA: AMP-binding protein [Acidimicrobiales bacterium]
MSGPAYETDDVNARFVADGGVPSAERRAGAVTFAGYPEGTPSVADLLVARVDDDHPAIVSGDASWTWAETAAAGAARAALLRSLGDVEPPHVGVLLGNVPEYLFWLGAAALSGAVVVGINPTRRGAALAGDVRRTDCRVLVTDAEGAALLDGLDTGVPPDRVLRVDTVDYADRVTAHSGVRADEVVAAAAPSASDLFLLLFTSGTTGVPKAVRCTQGRLASIALRSAEAYGYDRDDVAYCAMPLFHGNALMVLWGPTLAVGATVALARRFSASGFLPDVRRYGATTFTYVGKALAYVLATEPSPDDVTCSLRRGFGTEASVADHAAFQERFGCVLTEGYGSSEGGVAINRVPGTPVGSLGLPSEDVVVVDPITGTECPPAEFDASGVLVNGGAAVGEIVNRSGTGRFEGYYDDVEATGQRVRDGWYWTGDLAYRDAEGWFWFAGRGGDWLRVDSENLTAGPVERVLVRFDAAAAVAVYPVPDPRSGDQVMAAIELLPGRTFDPVAFAGFLGAQDDLGTKWAPAYLRVTAALPMTASGKVTKEPLRREGWWRGDDLLFRNRPASAGAGPTYVPMGPDDQAALLAELGSHGRSGLVTG